MAARAGTGNDRDKEGRVVSRRRAVVAILLALTFVLTTSTGEARDRTRDLLELHDHGRNHPRDLPQPRPARTHLNVLHDQRRHNAYGMPMSERIKTHEGASLKPPHHDPHLEHVGEAAILVLALLLAFRRCLSPLPVHAIPRLSLDRSHGHNTTTEAGFLVPVFVVPRGDRS